MAEIRRVLEGLPPNSRHIVRVRALSPLGVTSGWSEALEFFTPGDDSVPLSPTDLEIDFETPELVLSWTRPTHNVGGTVLNDFSHFRVTLTSGGVSKSYETNQSFFAYSFHQNELDFGTASPQIAVAIQTVDISGNISTPPLQGNAINLPPRTPPAPEGISAFTMIVLRMEGNALDRDIKGFIVERSSDDENFVQVASTDGDSYTDDVPMGSSFFYRVRARDYFEQVSDPSESTEISTVGLPEADTTPPEAVTDLRIVENGIDPNTGRPFASFEWSPNNVDDDLAYYEVRLVKTVGSQIRSDLRGPGASDHTFFNLEEETEYTAVVYLFDYSGNRSAISNEVPFTTLADDSQPSTPLGTNTASMIGAISVFWDPVLEFNVDTYEVYASKTQGFEPDTEDFTNRTFLGNANRYVHHAQAGETWYFRVRAISRNGVGSEFTPEFSGSTSPPLELDTSPPGVVDLDDHTLTSGLYVNQVNRYEAFVDWGWVDLEDSNLHYYDVRYSTVSDSGPWTYVQTPEPSIRINHINPGATVYLGVRGVSQMGVPQPVWSPAEISAAADNTAPDPVVFDIDASVFVGSDARAVWTHTKPVDFRHYHVRVYPTDSPESAVDYFTSDKQFTFTYAQNKVAFGSPQSNITIEVVAVDYANNPSTVAIRTYSNMVPGSFTASRATGQTTSVNLSWTEPSGGDISHYTVERKVAAASNDTYVVVGTVTSRVFIDTPPIGSYDYRITAFDVYGQSTSYSSTPIWNLSVTAPFTPDTTAPATPTQLANFPTTGLDSVFGDKAWIEQRWNAITDPGDFSHYRVEIRNASNSVVGTAMIGSRTTTIARFGNLTTDVSHTIEVRSVDRVGNASSPLTATITSNKDTVAPAAPTGLTASGGIDTISVSWNPVSAPDLAFYELHAGIDTSFSTTEANLVYKGPGTATSFRFPPGTTRVYKLYAVDYSGNRSTPVAVSNSATTIGMGLDIEPPSQVTGVTTTSATTYFHGQQERGRTTVSWDPATDNVGVAHYILRIRKGSDDWEEALVGSPPHTLNDLDPGSMYHFQVKAVDGAGNVSDEWSDPVSRLIVTESANTPDQVTWIASPGHAESLGIGSIKFTWNQVTNVTINDYEVTTATNSGFSTNVRTHFLKGTALTITGTPGVTYYARVRARSVYGVGGPWTDPVASATAKKLVTADVEVLDLGAAAVVGSLAATRITVGGSTVDAELAAKETPAGAQAKADAARDAAKAHADGLLTGQTTTYYQEDDPADDPNITLVAGDVWVEITNDGNFMYIWDGSEWLTITDPVLQEAINTANAAKALAEGKTTVYYATSPPSSNLKNGDLWFDTTDDLYKPHVYDGGWKFLSYIDNVANAAQQAAIDAAEDLDAALRGDLMNPSGTTIIHGGNIITDTVDAQVLKSDSAIINGLQIQSLLRVNNLGFIRSDNFHAGNKTGYQLSAGSLQFYGGSIVLGGSGLNINTETNQLWYGSSWTGAAWRVDNAGNMRVGTTDNRFNVTSAGRLRIGGNTDSAPVVITEAGLAQLRNVRILTTSLGTPTVDTDIMNIGEKFIVRRLANTTTDEVRLAGNMFIDAGGNLQLNGGSMTLTSGDLTLSGGNITVSTGNIRSSAAYNGTQLTGYRLQANGVLQASGADISGKITVGAGSNVYDTGTVDTKLTDVKSYVNALVSDIDGNMENPLVNWISGSYEGSLTLDSNLPSRAGVSAVNSPDASRGRLLRVEGASNTGAFMWFYSTRAIPVDTAHRYRMKIRLRVAQNSSGGTQTFYAGFACLNENFQQINENPGTHRYFVGENTPITQASGWLVAEGFIQGQGPTKGQFKTGTKWVRPMFITNYNGANSITEIDYIEVENMTLKEEMQRYSDLTSEPVNPGLITANSSFSDWPEEQALPTGMTAWNTAPTRSTTVTLTGKNAMRFNVTAVQAGTQLQPSFFKLTAPMEYVVVEVDWRLNSGTITSSGIVLDWENNGSHRSTINFATEVPSPVLNRWYTTRKILKRPASLPSGITGAFGGYVMANWTGFGSVATKDLYVDRLAVRAATDAEIAGHIADQAVVGLTWNGNRTTIDGGKIETNSIQANKLNIVVGGGNLLPESSFTQPLPSSVWNARFSRPEAITSVVDPALGTSHAAEIEIKPDMLNWPNVGGARDTGIILAAPHRPQIPPGNQVVFSVWVARMAGNSALNIGLQAFNSTDYLGGLGSIGITAAQLPNIGEYRRFFVISSANPPSGTDRIDVYIARGDSGSAIGDRWRVKNVQAELGDVPTAYAPKTDEILPGTIVANMLHVDAINAGMIRTGTLTAEVGIGTNGVIFASSTGNPSTGNRVVMSPSGLSGFAGVTETFHVGTDGNARFGGNLTGTNMLLSGTLAVNGAGGITGAGYSLNSTGISVDNGNVTLGTAGLSMLKGEIRINNDTFRVTTAGVLTATSATVTGTINASGGNFTGNVSLTGSGGFTATSGGNTVTLNATSGLTMNYGQININGKFIVSNTGSVTMRNAVLNPDASMAAGDFIINSNAFKVTAAGNVTANNLTVTSGNIGGVTVSDTTINGGTINGSTFNVGTGGINFTHPAGGNITWAPGANGEIIVANNGKIRSNTTIANGGWELSASGLDLGPGTVKASALQIGISTENLFTNSAFATDPAGTTGVPTGWVGAGSTTFSTQADANGFRFFGRALRMTGGSGTRSISQIVMPPGGFAVGDFASVSIWIRNAHSTARTAQIRMVDSDYEDPIWSTTASVTQAGQDSGWTRLSFTHRFTTAVNGVVVHFEVLGTTTAQVFYVDGASLTRSSFPVDYAPRALDMPANYINSAHISQLTADKLTSGTMTASIIQLSGINSAIQSFDFGSNSGWQIRGDGAATFQNGSVSIVGAGGNLTLDSTSLRAVYGGNTRFLVNSSGVFFGGTSIANSTLTVSTSGAVFFRSTQSGTNFTINMNPATTGQDPDVNKVLMLKNGSNVDTFWLKRDGSAFFAGELNASNMTGENTLTGNIIVDGFIRSRVFSSSTGWYIDAAGNAIFNSGFFRGDIELSKGANESGNGSLEYTSFAGSTNNITGWPRSLNTVGGSYTLSSGDLVPNVTTSYGAVRFWGVQSTHMGTRTNGVLEADVMVNYSVNSGPRIGVYARGVGNGLAENRDGYYFSVYCAGEVASGVVEYEFDLIKVSGSTETTLFNTHRVSYLPGYLDQDQVWPGQGSLGIKCVGAHISVMIDGREEFIYVDPNPLPAVTNSGWGLFRTNNLSSTVAVGRFTGVRVIASPSGQLRMSSDGRLWIGAPNFEDSSFSVDSDGSVRINQSGPASLNSSSTLSLSSDADVVITSGPNRKIRANYAVLEDTGWITIGTGGGNPGFLNGWGNIVGSTYSTAAFRRINGIVHLRGVISGGTIATGTTGNVFILPSRFRRAAAGMYVVPTSPSGASGRVDVYSDGSVRAVTGVNTWISLDGISFVVE